MTSPATPWSDEVYLAEVDRANRAEHTGTLDTTGHGNGNVARTRTVGAGADAYVVRVGADQSAAAISPAFDPLDPAALPPGHVPGPSPRTAPIY